MRAAKEFMSVTVLRSTWDEAKAHKTWNETGLEDYRLGVWFVGVELPCSGISDLYEILQSLQDEPQAIVVRAALNPDAADPRRRSTNRIEDAEPGLVKSASRLVVLDIDTAKPPVDSFLEGVQWVRDTIGWAAPCVAQATAKCHVKEYGFRCRLWYWAAEPISDEELVARLAALPIPVDISVARGHQPIYSAPPVFNGVPDPFKDENRLYFCAGEGELRFEGPPPTPVEEIPETEAIIIDRKWTRMELIGCDRELARWEAKLEACRSDRPNLLLKAASRLARLVPGGWSSREIVEERLLAAFAASYETETAGGTRVAGIDDGTFQEGLRLIGQGFKYARSNPEIVKPPRGLSAEAVAKAKTARTRAKKAVAENQMLLPVFAGTYAEQLSKGLVTEETAVTELRDALIEGGIKGGEAQTRVEAALAEAKQIRDKKESAEWLEDLHLDDEGKPRPTQANATLILERHPAMKGVLYYNARTLRIMLLKPPPWDPNTKVPRPLLDGDATAACTWLAGAGIKMFDAKPNAVNNAIAWVSMKNEGDPFLEYLESLRWDGLERLDTWLIDYAGAEDTEYVRAVSSKWLVSAVARAYQPGAQVDTMLILEGLQGTRKTSLMYALLGREEWYSAIKNRAGDKDALMSLHGPVILEMPELSTMRAWDVEATKAFITTRIDTFRPPYGKSMQSFPRRSILLGTTNQETYLPDTTGNRRFWPVAVTICDDAIAEVRDQIWAEAQARYLAGAQWWLTDAEERLAEQEQELRREEDPLEIRIAKLLSNPLTPTLKKKGGHQYDLDAQGRVQSLSTWELATLLDLKFERSEQTRLGRILKMRGWANIRSRSEDGTRNRRYSRPA